MPVEIAGEKNLLELIRKAGVKLPTFCYHSELSIYGACRMCMVENQWGEMEAACSSPPRPGARIRTNTERLRKYRKMILELLLANHCRDCVTCRNNKKCKLQDLAESFNIPGVRFPNTALTPKIDDSSLCVTRDQNKCILCGDCVRMCNEVQAVGAIDFAHRGAKMTVSAAFDRPLADSPCVGCGQCGAVCPTGAIVVRDDTDKVWRFLNDAGVKVTAQIAPAVRVAVGKAFGLPGGENAMGLIVAALRRLGFDEIYDTAVGADLTVLEEANELLGRLERAAATDAGGGPGDQDGTGAGSGPLFTSCCPAWVNYCERNYPELLPHVSSCRSPMQMLAAVARERDSVSSRRLAHVAVMPCAAKKFEAAREEFKIDGVPLVDCVITTQELIRMIREAGIVFSELEPEAVDYPLGARTGAGVIFGVAGGVTEAVLRRLAADKSRAALLTVAYQGVRGLSGVKEATIKVGEREIRIGMVSGLGNAAALIGRIKAGERYDFVEVMACPGGCVSGGGQPYARQPEKAERAKGLYAIDQVSHLRRSEENPLMMSLYNGVLRGRVKELLHVRYGGGQAYAGGQGAGRKGEAEV
ncbi:MAG: [FeFe] hydrogenase, group A [Peptococcaceae bacterium]|nr:[FeFe] hydrogenase, group A [Peptococcaceae bacterium]